MKIGIIYFSGTGNTKWAVEYIKDKIGKFEINIDVFNVAKNEKEKFTEYDNIIIAHPVYGANIPPIILKKIKKYKFADKVKISIITTFGYVNALGIFKESKELGLNIYSYINIKMFNNVSTPKLKSKILPLEKREKIRKRIEKKIDRKLKKIIEGKRCVDGIGPYLIPGKIIKRITKDKIYDNYERLSIDKDRCNNCMSCISNCPTAAIEKQDDEFTFNKQCTACMRCYNNCPKSAVIIDEIYADPNIYKRYKGPWI